MTNNNSWSATSSGYKFTHKTFDQCGYKIEISDTKKIESLKKNWLLLESKNQVPFFLTWNWVSCWIKTYHPHLICITAYFENKIVALGLFTNTSCKRHKFINSNQLFLHQMGNHLMDQIWMEYNDFICDESHRITAVNACLDVLQRNVSSWDEIIISMISRTRADHILESQPYTELDLHRPTYAVDLSEIRNKNQDYLSFLTANTRYQIRRSMRLYEKKYGSLILHEAQTINEALEFFDDAGKFHVQRWHDSGFKNSKFTDFHRNLIKDSFHDNAISLLRICANKETIAILYYHQVNGVLYFYLQGLKYEDDKNLKPGLVAHTMATNLFLKKGMLKYDYMGGYSQYKAQLAKRSEELVTVIIQRPRSRFKLEKVASIIKSWIIPKTQANTQTG